MNSRKLTTILAALRFFQDTITEEGPDPIINMDHFQDGTTPLSPDEIDDLCEELNCDCHPPFSISAQPNPLLAIPWTIHKSIDDKTQEQWIIETVSHDGRIDGICTIHGTGKYLTPERKAIAEIIASIPARIQAADPPPTRPLEELRIMLNAASYWADGEPDEDHPDPISIVCDLAREANDLFNQIFPENSSPHPILKHLDEEFTAIIEALDAGNPSRAHWLARKAKEHIANQPA